MPAGIKYLEDSSKQKQKTWCEMKPQERDWHISQSFRQEGPLLAAQITQKMLLFFRYTNEQYHLKLQAPASAQLGFPGIS